MASASGPGRWSASTSTSSTPTSRIRSSAIVRARLGDTLIRIGLWPKRLLLYRTDRPFAKMAAGGIEILGLGQQFVAFGRHPTTGEPYGWPYGETPLEVPFDQLPPVDAAGCAALLGEIAGLLPARSPPRPAARPRVARRSPTKPQPRLAPGPVRDASGRVVDGRDGWLSSIAYHVVQDAVAAGTRLAAAELAAIAWARFETTTNLERPAAHGAGYAIGDALRKVADKLRLRAQGRLAPRELPAVEADYRAPLLSAPEARERLEELLRAACDRIAAWHAAPESPCPGSASGPLSASARAPAPVGSCWRCAPACSLPAPRPGCWSSPRRTPWPRRRRRRGAPTA